MPEHPAVTIVQDAALNVSAQTHHPSIVLGIAAADSFGLQVAYARTPGLEPPEAMSCIETALLQERKIVQEMDCECASCAAIAAAIETCLGAMSTLKHGGKHHA